MLRTFGKRINGKEKKEGIKGFKGFADCLILQNSILANLTSSKKL